jgi:AraC-like DNA-binding protein
MLSGVPRPTVDRTPQTTPVRGLLGGSSPRPFALRRVLPAPDLAWCLEHHWFVSWDLPDGVEHQVDLLAHPSLNLSLTDGELAVWGVSTGVFRRVLRGRGQAYGAKFRPGGCHRFVGVEVTGLTDRVTRAGQFWPDAGSLERQLLQAPDESVPAETGSARTAQVETVQVEAVETFLRGLGVAPDPQVAEVDGWVQALLSDPGVRRVVDVGELAGVSARALQRIFRRWVGVPPRWVLQRGRLHEVAARIATDVLSPGTGRGWSSLAADLGYADQAHFIRSFRDVVGHPPGRYTEICRERAAALA